MLNKVNKTIGLPQNYKFVSLSYIYLGIYKLFNRTHFDYSDFIYDQAYNASMQQMIESIDCNVSLAITEIIRGTYKNKILKS